MDESAAYKYFRAAIAKFDTLMSDPHPGLITWNLAISDAAKLIVIKCEEWRKTWQKTD